MMLIITLIALFARIHRFIDVDDLCLNRAIALHNITQNITRSIRPLKINIPILLYTLANLQYRSGEYKIQFFPINTSRELIKKALEEMSYRTNWVNGTGRYNIKSLKRIKDTIRADEVSRLSATIYAIFQKEMSAEYASPISFVENCNKYKIDGYYDVIYSTHSKEISGDIKLALSTIITYSVLNRDPGYCYNSISWRPNVYKIFMQSGSRCLDCFSSPIHPTIRPYCSMFPQDTFFDGCVGAFSIETLKRIRPDILFCNPTIDPFTGTYCMETLDQYLSEHDAMAIITTQCTLGRMPNYVDPASTTHNIVASSILDHCFRSSRTLGFIIIPIDISRSSLIYQNNTRLTKSSIEIETSYMMIFYGKLPSTYQSVTAIKRLLIDRLRQNCEVRSVVAYRNYGVLRPNISEINKIKSEYGWSIDVHKEMSENIRLFRSYFDN